MVMELTAASTVSRAEVDTSRPFQSVREAVEVFGERYAGGGSSSNASSESSIKLGAVPPAASSVMQDCLKKLEVDLAEAKDELVQLKQRQSQMEIAVSSLSVQFRKGLAVYSSLSKGKELAIVDAPAIGAEEDDDGKCRVRSDRWDESRAEEWMANLEYLPSLSEALSIKMIEDDLGQRKERKVKSNKASRKKHKKSGISLVGGIFSKKTKSR